MLLQQRLRRPLQAAVPRPPRSGPCRRSGPGATGRRGGGGPGAGNGAPVLGRGLRSRGEQERPSATRAGLGPGSRGGCEGREREPGSPTVEWRSRRGECFSSKTKGVLLFHTPPAPSSNPSPKPFLLPKTATGGCNLSRARV